MNATEKWKPPQRRRVYLVRHGEVSYFEQAGKPARPDLVPLNESGRHQALMTAPTLAAIPWDRVITSGLRRTEETAQLLLAGRSAPMERHECLQEIRPGKLGTQEPAEIEAAMRASFGFQLNSEATFLGGETYHDFLNRVVPWWRGFLADPTWNQVLIVAHGGVNRAILGHVLGLGLTCFGLLEQDPCCVNLIEVEPSGQCWLRLVNATIHDPNKMTFRLTTMERLYQEFLGEDPR